MMIGVREPRPRIRRATCRPSNARAATANSTGNLQAVDVRQPDVEDDRVETCSAVGRLETVATGGSELHDVTVFGEEANEKSPEARIILDHKQVHRTGLTRVSERTLKTHVMSPSPGLS